MINTNRIVPVQATDLLTLYALILKQDTTNNSSLAKLAATNPGEFHVTSGSAPLIANEPVTTCDIASGVTSATLYFVAGFDYKGFTVNGAAATMAGVTVTADRSTLYKAVLATGIITISAVGL